MIGSAGSSLLDPHGSAPEQLDLIASSEMDDSVFKIEGRNPVFTAERYLKHHPHEYKLAVSLLFGDRLPIKTVAEMLGASRGLIATIYERESESVSVEHEKRAAQSDWRTIIRIGREQLRNLLLHLPEPEDLTPDQLGAMIHKIGVVVGIGEDKLAALSGTVVPRVSINVNVNEDGYSDLLSHARDLAERMRCGGGALGQKGIDGELPGCERGVEFGAGGVERGDHGPVMDAEYEEGNGDV